MSDPYKVLGISRDATDEQVKEAYREMAKNITRIIIRAAQLQIWPTKK